MAKRNEVYKCELCGNIVMVQHGGVGELVCCNEPMSLLDEQSADLTTEKHVPVIEKIDGGYRVTVGSTIHPMLDKHYIEWVELVTENETLIHYFAPGDEPVAEFQTDAEKVVAREYCNLHGLWKNEL